MIEAGQRAPGFSLQNQNGKIVSLNDFTGKYVVVYFYPKAMTPGCTTETCNFQEKLPDFDQDDAVILGISKDPVDKQKKFADKYNVEFSLLSDEDGKVCEAFGVWQKKKLYGKEFMGIVRSTFIIGPDGTVVKTYSKVKVKEHHHEVFNDLQELKK